MTISNSGTLPDSKINQVAVGGGDRFIRLLGMSFFLHLFFFLHWGDCLYMSVYSTLNFSLDPSFYTHLLL